MNMQELLDAVGKATESQRKAIYRRLASELEHVTISLPACGPEQTIEQRYGATELDMGNLNVYANEGRLLVTCGNEILLRAGQDGAY